MNRFVKLKIASKERIRRAEARAAEGSAPPAPEVVEAPVKVEEPVAKAPKPKAKPKVKASPKATRKRATKKK